MDLNPTLAGLLVLFLCLYLEISCNGVEGGMVLSPQDHLEIEKELKLLNKPAVKSIKTAHGHMFDCVDFYKQPAFDHPLLKNHSYHLKMKPQFRNENFDIISGRERRPFSLKGGGCPTGTVPIRRITKKDLVREKFASKSVDFGGTYDNDGNWWLSVRRKNRHVGFWPSKLFTSLADSATYIDWGGEVYSPHGQYVPLPPMGSGIKPLGLGNVKTNGYFRWIAAIDTSGNNFSPDKSPKTHTFNTDQQSINYGLQDVLMVNPVWGHTVFFGGTN